MTRKDYVLLAASIHESYKYATTANIRRGVSVVMNNIADALERSNPEFDREKFTSACINGK
jgi:hypothetical protein